jgi:hypothetical protein
MRSGGRLAQLSQASRAGKPMESQESYRLRPRLQHRFGPTSDAAHVAEAIVSTWQDIDAVLCPVIGRGGVAAVYLRSLHLVGSAHPWLGHRDEGFQAPMDLGALKAVLAQQSSADAAAGGVAFLQTLQRVLAGLVGGSLTDTLLGSVWIGSSNCLPDQNALR